MLFHSGLNKIYWSETAHTTYYLINRCPICVLDFKTPMQLWSDHDVDYNMLRVFGCLAYAHMRQDKLDPRALKCVFLGYPKGVKGYQLLCIESSNQRVILSRDVKFKENVFPLKPLKSDVNIPDISISNVPNNNHKLTSSEVESSQTVPMDRSGVDIEGNKECGQSVIEEHSGNLDGYQLARDRERIRGINRPLRYRSDGQVDYVAFTLSVAQEVENEEPKNV